MLEPINYTYLTVPSEWEDTYKLLLYAVSDAAQDIISGCACSPENQVIINCWNVFQSAIAAKAIGDDEKAQTYIEYIQNALEDYSTYTDIDVSVITENYPRVICEPLSNGNYKFVIELIVNLAKFVTTQTKALVGVDVPTITDTTFVYDGTTSYKPLVDTDSYTVNYSSDDTYINAGSHTVTLKIKDGYKWNGDTANDTEDKTLTYNIYAATINPELSITSDKVSQIYSEDGNSIAITNITGFDSSYMEIDEDNSKLIADNGVDEYSVKVKSKANTNYSFDDITLTWNVTKKTIQYPRLSPNVTYNGAKQSCTITGTDINYFYYGTLPSTNDDGDVTSATVNFTLKNTYNSKNYNITGTASPVWKVYRKQISISKSVTPTITYSGTANKANYTYDGNSKDAPYTGISNGVYTKANGITGIDNITGTLSAINRSENTCTFTANSNYCFDSNDKDNYSKTCTTTDKWYIAGKTTSLQWKSGKAPVDTYINTSITYEAEAADSNYDGNETITCTPTSPYSSSTVQSGKQIKATGSATNKYEAPTPVSTTINITVPPTVYGTLTDAQVRTILSVNDSYEITAADVKNLTVPNLLNNGSVKYSTLIMKIISSDSDNISEFDIAASSPEWVIISIPTNSATVSLKDVVGTSFIGTENCLSGVNGVFTSYLLYVGETDGVKTSISFKS